MNSYIAPIRPKNQSSIGMKTRKKTMKTKKPFERNLDPQCGHLLAVLLTSFLHALHFFSLAIPALPSDGCEYTLLAVAGI